MFCGYQPVPSIGCVFSSSTSNFGCSVQDFLKLASFDFASRTEILTGHEIALFQPLMQRVDPKAVAAMVDASKDSLAAPAEAPKAEKKKRKQREES